MHSAITLLFTVAGITAVATLYASVKPQVGRFASLARLIAGGSND